jgi:L-lactate dehydrogenase (cytochrome)
MIARCPATCDDYRALARRRLPRFLFDYVDGGAGDERTMAANVEAWARLGLRQRVMMNVDGVATATTLAGDAASFPVALAPVGLVGMMARRGEAQAARAAEAVGIPFTLSTVGICGLEEVAAASPGRLYWFQLYMLRDRGLVAAMLERAWAAGVRTIVFTVDLPLPGMRHRDTRNGLGQAGLRPKLLRLVQVLSRPHWVVDVGIRGKPHSFGSLGPLVPAARALDDFRAWVDAQFDPTVTWSDIGWVRERWRGKLLLKGVLDPDDAIAAVSAGADALVVSNHGGRQLDGASATAQVLPRIVARVGERAEVLVDGGIRSGIDVFRALALGARGVLVGRPWVYALAGDGERGVRALLATWHDELRRTMTLAGVTRVGDIGPQHLARD